MMPCKYRTLKFKNSVSLKRDDDFCSVFRAKSKAQKLKIYFGKLCDEEAKSAKRNQQLLNDIQRVDIEFQKLEKKLDRLNSLKVNIQLILNEQLLNYFRSLNLNSFRDILDFETYNLLIFFFCQASLT